MSASTLRSRQEAVTRQLEAERRRAAAIEAELSALTGTNAGALLAITNGNGAVGTRAAGLPVNPATPRVVHPGEQIEAGPPPPPAFGAPVHWASPGGAGYQATGVVQGPGGATASAQARRQDLQAIATARRHEQAMQAHIRELEAEVKRKTAEAETNKDKCVAANAGCAAGEV